MFIKIKKSVNKIKYDIEFLKKDVTYNIEIKI